MSGDGWVRRGPPRGADLALALAALAACHGHPAPSPRASETLARLAVSPGATPALAYAALTATLPSPARLTAASLAPEPASAFVPAVPDGCALAGPVRALALPGDAPALFATALAPSLALLSVAVSLPGDGAALDAATYLASPASPEPRWLRGPLEPGSNAVAASASGDAVALAWSVRARDERTSAPVRLALFRRGDMPPAVHTLANAPEALVTDLACASDRCALAYGTADLYAPPESADRAAFALFAPSPELSALETVAAPEAFRPSNALVPTAGAPFVGTASREHGLALITRAPAQPRALAPAVLDVARVGDAVYALTAHAPGDAPCQPGAWVLELSAVAPDGALGAPVSVATLDARPRGARIRAVGARPEPLVTFVDAPQCSRGSVVLRAFRRGRLVALASAQEYDVATAGRELSLVLRHDGALRWIRAACE